MRGLLGNSIAPGIDGFVAQRQLAGQENMQNMAQVQGLLGMQQAQQQQGLLAQQMQDKQKQQMQIEQFAGTLPPQERATFLVNPTAYINEMNKKYVVGGALVPGKGGAPIYEAPVENKIGPNGQVYNPRQLVPGQTFNDPNKAFGMGPQGQPVPNQSFQSFELNRAARGAPSITNKVNMAQETEENKAIGKELGQQYADIQKNGMMAGSKVTKLDRMSQLSSGIKTGKLTPAMTEIGAIADSLGVKIDKNLGPKQAFEALSNEVALSLRSTGDGGGMPGAMSDKDREFLKAMTPSLSQTPEGNKLIIESGMKLAKRQQDVARLAREYRAKNRTLEGFSDYMQNWADKNPLFTKSSNEWAVVK